MNALANLFRGVLLLHKQLETAAFRIHFLFSSISWISFSGNTGCLPAVWLSTSCGNGYAGLFLLFSDWSCKGAGPAAARVCASQKRIYATRLQFFFQLHKCMRISEAHRSVCSTVAYSPILAVQVAERALTACNYCQNHPLTLFVDVIVSASADVRARTSPKVQSRFSANYITGALPPCLV